MGAHGTSHCAALLASGVLGRALSPDASEPCQRQFCALVANIILKSVRVLVANIVKKVFVRWRLILFQKCSCVGG